MKVFKPAVMPLTKLRQFRYESETWKRLLMFMAEENIFQKKRLSEVLNEEFDNDLLIAAERFQSSFIKEDDLIRLLQSDIAEFDRLLVRKLFEDGTIIKDVERKFNNIRNNISIAEKQFGSLKLAFNNYLLAKVENPG